MPKNNWKLQKQLRKKAKAEIKNTKAPKATKDTLNASWREYSEKQEQKRQDENKSEEEKLRKRVEKQKEEQKKQDENQISIIVMTGLPGVGKTTIAKNLAPLLDATVLSSDEIRKELFANPTYRGYESKRIYQEMMWRAKYLHKESKNCILDATFTHEEYRNQVKEKTECSDEEFFIVEFTCPEEVALLRLRDREDDYSDADESTYKKMKGYYEPVQGKHITIDTTKDAKLNANLIFKKLN